MKAGGREVEPWRVPVIALRALEKQLSAQPEQFTVAIAAEKLLALLTPDVSAMNVSPLSGLAGVAEKARPEAAPATGRTPRPREKAPLPAPSAPSAGSTNRFADVSNVIGTALQRGAAAMGNAPQSGSGIGRALAGGDSAGGKSGMAGLGKVIADAVVALPVDPARRGNGGAAASAREPSVVPIASKQGGAADKKSPFAAAALAAMEALTKAQEDQGATPEAAAKKRAEGSALDTGLEAIQRVGELAGKVIDAGTQQLARRQGGFVDAIAGGVAAAGKGAGTAAAPDSTLGRVDRLATDLLARGIAAGAMGGLAEALAGGTTTAGSTPSPAGQVSAAKPATVAAPAAPAPAAAPQGAAPPASTMATELPDAAAVTALVNEVLMEQARRHGVDLT